ncbi:Hypothetical predicted protein, partial [Olea europaea subsp. europaea]
MGYGGRKSRRVWLQFQMSSSLQTMVPSFRIDEEEKRRWAFEGRFHTDDLSNVCPAVVLHSGD